MSEDTGPSGRAVEVPVWKFRVHELGVKVTADRRRREDRDLRALVLEEVVANANDRACFTCDSQAHICQLAHVGAQEGVHSACLLQSDESQASAGSESTWDG